MLNYTVFWRISGHLEGESIPNEEMKTLLHPIASITTPNIFGLDSIILLCSGVLIRWKIFPSSLFGFLTQSDFKKFRVDCGSVCTQTVTFVSIKYKQKKTIYVVEALLILVEYTLRIGLAATVVERKQLLFLSLNKIFVSNKQLV